MGARRNYYYRHPRTYQAKRFNEAHKEFVRSKRKGSKLPDDWSDKYSYGKSSKSWKDRYKCSRQWMRENRRWYCEWENPRELIERLCQFTGLGWDECEEAVASTARTHVDIFGNNESAPYYDYGEALEYIKEKYKMLLLILRG